MKSLFAILGLAILPSILVLVLLITCRLFIEARYIPAEAMFPALNVGDRVFIEKVKTFLDRPHSRGEIVIFYPPPIEMGGTDLSPHPLNILGRLTGLPFLPHEIAFVKRVIGLPGDRIEIKRGEGVFINGHRLNEQSYVIEPPDYDRTVLGDIGGPAATGKLIRPYGESPQSNEPIIVPPDNRFVLGDNRNNSEDSHVFGMLPKNRVIGRAFLKFYPRTELIEPPEY